MEKNNIIILSVIIVVLAGLYYFSSASKPANNNISSNVSAGTGSNQQNLQDEIVLNLDAKRWQFTPDVISVKRGQRVKIIVNNTDTIHGINLPDFNAVGDNSVEFLADKTGEFTFYCKNFCGNGHASMTGKIIVSN